MFFSRKAHPGNRYAYPRSSPPLKELSVASLAGGDALLSNKRYSCTMKNSKKVYLVCWLKYSCKFSSMMSRTAFSTSGDAPRKRRRGIRMVVPTFLSARNFQNCASSESWMVRLSLRCEPSFFRPNAPVAW